MLSAIPPPPVPAPRRAPRRLDVGPVHERLRPVLEAGMTYTDIAVAAGIPRTTLYRILRPDVCTVSTSTQQLRSVPSTCGLGVSVQRPRGRRRHNATTAIARAQRRRANVFAAGGHFVNGRATNAATTQTSAGRRTPARHTGALHVAIRPVPLRRLPHRDERRPGSSQTCAAASPRRIARTVASRQSSTYCPDCVAKPDSSIVGMANRRCERRDPTCRWDACWSWATRHRVTAGPRPRTAASILRSMLAYYADQGASSASRWSRPSLRGRHASSIDLVAGERQRTTTALDERRVEFLAA